MIVSGVFTQPEGRKGKFKTETLPLGGQCCDSHLPDALSRLATQFDRDGQPMGGINL